jgi:putative PIN family toxin of toxin-antitoxin system
MDTNVILNGITGPKGTINQRIYAGFQRNDLRLVVSEALLMELETIFDYPQVVALGITPKTAARVVRELLLLGEYIAPVPQVDWVSLSDKKDWYLLDLLFESRADALITQDQKILRAGEYLKMPVCDPKTFIETVWI